MCSLDIVEGRRRKYERKCRVVSEDVKHGEEINIEEEWAEDRALGDTMSYGAGGGRVSVNPD